MGLPKVSWDWKEGFRFALCWEFRNKEDFLSFSRYNKAEIFGSWIIDPLYKILDHVCRHLQKPMTVVLVTLFLSLVLGVAFYNIPAFVFLGKILPAKIIRFSLFSYIELVFLGLGCRAWGRFQNRSLVQLWKKGQLISCFPGEKNH